MWTSASESRNCSGSSLCFSLSSKFLLRVSFRVPINLLICYLSNLTSSCPSASFSSAWICSSFRCENASSCMSSYLTLCFSCSSSSSETGGLGTMYSWLSSSSSSSSLSCLLWSLGLPSSSLLDSYCRCLGWESSSYSSLEGDLYYLLPSDLSIIINYNFCII